MPTGLGGTCPENEKKATTKALLIASSVAPGLIGCFLYAPPKQLRATARIVGARPVGSLFIGLMSQQAQLRLRDRER